MKANKPESFGSWDKTVGVPGNWRPFADPKYINSYPEEGGGELKNEYSCRVSSHRKIRLTVGLYGGLKDLHRRGRRRCLGCDPVPWGPINL